MFNSTVIADTISDSGKRITTLEVTYPRFIHAEIMTHRDRSRNAGSSRAIPWTTMSQAIQHNPVVPILFGAEKKGMQTGEEIEHPEEARVIWLRAKTHAIQAAEDLHKLGVHKSICNRLTEPFMWITVVMTSTNWRNFFAQRLHPAAEIHMREIAYLMRQSILKSEPEESYYHLPYIQEDDYGTNESRIAEVLQDDKPFEALFQVSTARCARVSYVQHGEKAKSVAKDLGLFEKLLTEGHWSPFEHPSMAIDGCSGPYVGWKSYRKFFPNECPIEGYPS